MATEPAEPSPSDDDSRRVPLFGTWRTAYIVVLVWLAVQVIGFAWISRMAP